MCKCSPNLFLSVKEFVTGSVKISNLVYDLRGFNLKCCEYSIDNENNIFVNFNLNLLFNQTSMNRFLEKIKMYFSRISTRGA